MRTIPYVNNPDNPPFRFGMATVRFLKICGSLEKLYMNPQLENSKKRISAKRHGHVDYAEAHTCTCTRQVRSTRTCCCLSCCCEETTNILARASSLSVFLSVKAQSKAPYALKIRVQTWFGCKTSLKTGTNLAILKQCTRPWLSRKSLHRDLVPLIPGRIMSCKHCSISSRVESSRDDLAFTPRQACFCLGSRTLREIFLFDMMKTSKTELEYRSHEVHNTLSSKLYSWQLRTFASRTVFF